jgi:hypothetical protein
MARLFQRRGSTTILAVLLLVTAGATHAVGNASGVTVINVDARVNGLFLVTFPRP